MVKASCIWLVRSRLPQHCHLAHYLTRKSISYDFIPSFWPYIEGGLALYRVTLQRVSTVLSTARTSWAHCCSWYNKRSSQFIYTSSMTVIIGKRRTWIGKVEFFFLKRKNQVLRRSKGVQKPQARTMFDRSVEMRCVHAGRAKMLLSALSITSGESLPFSLEGGKSEEEKVFLWRGKQAANFWSFFWLFFPLGCFFGRGLS